MSQWAEFLQPTTAKTLATYDHPFFGRWPAITKNQFGKGTLTYEGTALSEQLQQAIVQLTLRDSGIPFDPEASRSAIRVKSGSNASGRSITYLLNYSSAPADVKYAGNPAHDLLTGRPLSPGQVLSIQAWDLVIAESDGTDNKPSR